MLMIADAAFDRIGRLVRHFRYDDRGLAFVEFAMMAPMLALLMLGTLEVGQAYTASRKVERTTAAIADLIARETAPTATSINQIFDLGDVLIKPYPVDKLAISAFYFEDDAGKPKLIWKCWNGVGAEGTPPASLPAGALESGGKVIVVTASYEYTPDITQFLISQPIVFSETYHAKLRALSFSSKPTGSGCS